MRFTAGCSLRRLVIAVAFLFLCLNNVSAHEAFEREIERLNKEIEAHPDSAELLIQRSQVYLTHGNCDEALADLDAAERLAPGRFPTGALRGEALAAAGRFREARPVLDKFIESHPDRPRAFLIRARVLSELNEKKEALADFRRALDLSPQPEPDLVLEVADFLAANSRVDDAIEVLDRQAAKTGFVPSLTLRAIDLEILRRNWDGALHRVGEMQERAPRPEPWIARRASILAQAGQISESRKAWEALLAHLASLPPPERSSHALTLLAEEARQALAALEAVSAQETTPAREKQ